MRGLLVVAIVAGGCYRPSDPACVIACTQGVASACPSGLACGAASLCEPTSGPSCNAVLDAGEGDSIVDIDAPRDSGPAPFCSETMFSSIVAILPAGQQFTVNRAHTRRSLVATGVYVNEINPDSTMSTDDVSVLQPPPGSIEMYSARIDPTGELIFATADNGAAMDEGLAYLSTRIGPETWSAFTPITFEVIDSPTTLVPGAAIGGTTDPVFGVRRLPLASGQNFQEYVEKTPGVPTTFSFAATFSGADFGIDHLRDPSFTPDGLRIVFIGQVGSNYGIYTSSRTTVTSAWAPANRLRVVGSSDTSPYLTNDCMHLYWTESTNGRHAVHQ